MAGYGAIRDALESLASLLRAHITDSGEAGLQGVPIRVNSPREVEQANVANAVAVWLHRVDVQADMINRTPPRPEPGLLPRHPVPVELAVQIVPMNSDAGTAHLLLGRVFQIMNDHRRIAGADLSGSLAASGTVLTLGLGIPGSYDLNLVWSGQQTTIRPGAWITMTGLVIDSHLDPVASAPVIDVSAGLGQIVGVGA
jgi:hypothetical protein